MAGLYIIFVSEYFKSVVILFQMKEAFLNVNVLFPNTVIRDDDSKSSDNGDKQNIQKEKKTDVLGNYFFPEIN